MKQAIYILEQVSMKYKTRKRSSPSSTLLQVEEVDTHPQERSFFLNDVNRGLAQFVQELSVFAPSDDEGEEDDGPALLRVDEETGLLCFGKAKSGKKEQPSLERYKESTFNAIQTYQRTQIQLNTHIQRGLHRIKQNRAFYLYCKQQNQQKSLHYQLKNLMMSTIAEWPKTSEDKSESNDTSETFECNENLSACGNSEEPQPDLAF